MLHAYPTLFVTWRSATSRRIHPVGRLTCDVATDSYEFRYIRSAIEATEDGFVPFPEFRKLDGVYKSVLLFPMFANRVMPSSRTGHATFLTALGLASDTANPMAILARTGGSRATDQIEMFPQPEPDGQVGRYSTHFLLRAVRYMPHPATEERIAKLTQGERLYLMHDFQNPVDPNAVVVRTADNAMLGYLPAYLTADHLNLRNACDNLSVFVDRFNPPPAEAHHRLLCRIVSYRPGGFRPFDTPAFQTIVPEAE